MQLAQAIGSGRLAGDEFRSVSEQIPGVLIPIAKEMNVTVGELKELGSEGKITSDVLINALSNGVSISKEEIKAFLAEQPARPELITGRAEPVRLACWMGEVEISALASDWSTVS